MHRGSPPDHEHISTSKFGWNGILREEGNVLHPNSIMDMV